ncbi:unnamed protein product, partial [Amoebophrya sp. A120]|eukprot:GSA120T00001714001.1
MICVWIDLHLSWSSDSSAVNESFFDSTNCTGDWGMDSHAIAFWRSEAALY